MVYFYVFIASIIILFSTFTFCFVIRKNLSKFDEEYNIDDIEACHKEEYINIKNKILYGDMAIYMRV